MIALSLVANLRVNLLVLGYGHLVGEAGVAAQLLHRRVADAAQDLNIRYVSEFGLANPSPARMFQFLSLIRVQVPYGILIPP